MSQDELQKRIDEAIQAIYWHYDDGSDAEWVVGEILRILRGDDAEANG